MKRVLVVDDEEDIRLLARLLLRSSYDVQEASTATEALALIERSPPDVLLLDLRLPDQDGWSVLERLRRDGLLGATRVIMVSAHAAASGSEQAMAVGADRYITKPFTAAELLDAVRSALA